MKKKLEEEEKEWHHARKREGQLAEEEKERTIGRNEGRETTDKERKRENKIGWKGERDRDGGRETFAKL